MHFVVQVCACWKKVEPKHTGKNFCKRYFSVLEKAQQSWIPKASWWLSSLVAPTFHENSPYERQKRRWTRASRNTDVPDLSPTPEERRPEGRERRKSTLKTEQENCVTADCRITAKKKTKGKDHNTMLHRVTSEQASFSPVIVLRYVVEMAQTYEYLR